MTLAQNIAQQIAPNISTNSIHVTRDSLLWHKVINGRLMAPGENILRTNLAELDKFIEVCKAVELGRPLYDWSTPPEYQIIETPEALQELRNQLEASPPDILACDIETRNTGYDDNKLLAIGLAWENGLVAIKWHPSMKSGLQGILNLGRVRYLWHNGKFDTARLKYLEDIDAHVDEDTMLLHFVGISEKRGTHGLKRLGQLYLQTPPWEAEVDALRKQYAKAHKCKLADFTYDLIPMSILLKYMVLDCQVTLRLFDMFKELQEPGTQDIYRTLIKASNTFREIELRGMPVSEERLEEAEWELEQDIKTAQAVLNTQIAKYWNPQQYAQETGSRTLPEAFNIQSSKQLKWLLEKVTGRILSSASEETLLALKDAATDSAQLEFLESLQRYRVLIKLLGTYITGMREKVCKDWRIRGTFNLHGTETGRLSSTDPNLQNIPRVGPVKGVYTAPPGYVFLQLDYSQAELRVLAYFSKDEFLRNVYLQGLDIHGTIAKEVYGPNWGPEDRSSVKRVIFGSVYGVGPAHVGEILNISVTEAQALIAKVFSYMPNAKLWLQERKKMALKGEDLITVTGRRRHLVLTGNEHLSHIQNEFLNTPIQSAASDLTLMSLLRIHDWCKQECPEAHVVCTVHDSIILEVPEDRPTLELVARKCEAVMKEIPFEVLKDCTVPFKADAEYGKHWKGLKSVWDSGGY